MIAPIGGIDIRRGDSARKAAEESADYADYADLGFSRALDGTVWRSESAASLNAR